MEGFVGNLDEFLIHGFVHDILALILPALTSGGRAVELEPRSMGVGAAKDLQCWRAPSIQTAGVKIVQVFKHTVYRKRMIRRWRILARSEDLRGLYYSLIRVLGPMEVTVQKRAAKAALPVRNSIDGN